MAEHRNMRASDADRAQITEQLWRATEEGRLFAHEFDDRLGQALNARTYGELDAIVADLPRERVPAGRPGRVVVKAAAAAGAVAAVVVVLLAPATATHVASQQALVSLPAASRPPTPPRPPAPPPARQPPTLAPRQPVASP
jgi:hypothetical protein